MPDQSPPWFDAHLDLAFLAETGRDMHVDPEESRGRYQPAAVTLPSLAEGRVTRVLATVFTESIADPSAPDAETGAFAYPAGDVDKAYVSGMRQLKLYHAWHNAGVIEMPTRVHPDATASIATTSRGRRPAEPEAPPLTVGVLVENADPITSPDDLGLWVEGGVVAIGLTWANQGRYASGNSVSPDGPESGLTDLGRALVASMDELGVVHDASHLNDRSLADLFEATDRRVIASHSNSRALLADKQRHLTDDAIREIARRGGVIGLNLCSAFLDDRCWKDGRATIDDAVRLVEHVCEVIGDRRHVGLGSDMDGGFPASRLPEGVDRPCDLDKIGEALRGRGWNDDDIAGFMHGNWERVFPVLA
ncbi:MAG: membrane dipeptidase [Phycisphaeraceae bacterium]|nr:MAG: membrane dipeptidase [Phycisphaeraceae bacterium]